MNKKDRLNEAFVYLRDKGVVKTQKDIAEQMGTTSPNVSSALKGVESVLTDRFIERFCLAFQDIDKVWLLTGEGEMLKHTQTITGDGNVQVAGNAHNVNAGKTLDAALREVENAHNIISKMQLQMDTLLAVIEKLTDQKK